VFSLSGSEERVYSNPLLSSFLSPLLLSSPLLRHELHLCVRGPLPAGLLLPVQLGDELPAQPLGAAVPGPVGHWAVGAGLLPAVQEELLPEDISGMTRLLFPPCCNVQMVWMLNDDHELSNKSVIASVTHSGASDDDVMKTSGEELKHTCVSSIKLLQSLQKRSGSSSPWATEDLFDASCFVHRTDVQ